MTRIKPLVTPLGENEQKQMDKIFPKEIPSPNLYRMVYRNKALFEEMIDSRFIGPTGLWDRRRLAPHLREKIILRTCVATCNDYEFALHVDTISENMGVTKAQLADIQNDQLEPSLWAEKELPLFELIDGLVNKIQVSDETYTKLSAHFSEEELLDITHLVGLYTGVAMMVALGKPAFDNYR